MSRIMTWNVTGMTCHSCEKIVGTILDAVPGVEESEVSLKKGRAGIRLRDGAPEPDLADLNEQLKEHGYALCPERPSVPRESNARGGDCRIEARDPFARRVKRAIVAMAAVGGVSLVVLGPLRNLVPNVTATASLGAMIAFGLVASVSSCLASTGGFILAYNGRPRTGKQLVAVHLGRFAAFLLGGAALGMIGSALPGVSQSLYGVLALALGVLFLLMGLHMLDLTPSLARLGLTLPKRLLQVGERVSASDHPSAPFLVGATTFLLPCGFTQTAQALALASGSPFTGMLLMGAFSLGTFPVLGGLSAFGSAQALRHRAVQLATGAVLAFFAVGQIDGGLTVLGSPVTPGTLFAGLGAGSGQPKLPEANAKEQVVRMTVDGSFSPRSFKVRKGIPVRWEINGVDVGGCVSSIVIPTYRIQRSLKPGLNVITFTPQQTGSIPFSCGMGMIRGSFTVTS